MPKGKFSMFDKPKKAYIKTQKFYVKYSGMIDIDSDCLVNQETEKALLIRYRILPENHNIHKTCSSELMSCFSDKAIWISKTKIIEFKYLEE